MTILITRTLLIAAFIFLAVVDWWIARTARVQRLNDKLHDILMETIDYPYLEAETFTNSWDEKLKSHREYVKSNPSYCYGQEFNLGATNDPFDERYLRYDQFANIVFNYMSEVYHFFGGNRKKIEQFIDMKAWIILHRQIWLNPVTPGENDCYDAGFRKLLDTYIIEYCDEEQAKKEKCERNQNG